MEEQIMDSKLYGKRLKELREKNGYSLRYLAETVGVTKQCLSKIENDKNKSINLDLLKKLSSYLCCSDDYLLGKSDSPDRNSDNMICPISFIPEDDLSRRLMNKKLDPAFIRAFLDCFDRLNSKQRNILKKMMENIVELFEAEEKKGSNTLDGI